MTLQETIIQILVSKKLITPDLVVSKSLRKAILCLSDSFTRNRADLFTNYFDEEINRMAYLGSFVLTNSAKVAACLEQVRNFLPAHKPLSILDIGTGPGTAIFAASSAFPGRAIRFVGVEKNRRILGEARNFEVHFRKNHSADWIVGNANSIPDKKYDLVIAANVLNELKPKDQFKAFKKILSCCETLVIIDPALKQTTRQLMSLRDKLLENGVAFTLSPCTHQKACPMLKANERDWCHFYLEWQRPRLIEAIDRATGLDHRHLKLSFLVLRTTNHESRSTNLWRVVSAPLKSKGKLELVVCGDGKLKRLRRLDKNASDKNGRFGAAKRGDAVQFSEKERPGEIRASDHFQILSSLTPQPSNP